MLLLLPGLICDAAMFAPQVAAFPQARTVAGYGEEASLAGMARRVLVDAPERFDLLGHSMGGRVALELARIAPGRVRRIALLSTGVHGVRPGEAEGRHRLRDLGRREGFAALVDAWLPPMVGPEAKADPALMQTMRAMCLRQGQAVFEAQVAALLGRSPAEDVLATLSCPALVLTGELDTWSPPAQHAAIAEQLADSVLTVVPGAGHMVTLEKPEAVNRAIAAWLART